MKLKKIYLGALAITLGLALTSCGGESEARNTQTPTGSLDLNATIATAYNGKLSMSNDQFYTQLRYKSYDVFNSALKASIYSNDLEVIKTMLNTPSSSFSTLSNEVKDALSYSYTENDSTLTVNVTEEKYKVLRSNLLEKIHTALSSSIYGTSSLSSLKSKSDKDLTKLKAQYVDSMARKGITVDSSKLDFVYPDDNTSSVDPDLLSKNVAYFTNYKYLVDLGVLDSTLLTQAETLNARRALYQIAHLEEIENPEYDPEVDDEDNKIINNTNYLFKETSLENAYDSSYKTFGEYNVILIQFNSKREATETIKKVEQTIPTLNDSNAKEYYLSLYNTYYSYKDSIYDTADSSFLYNISEYESDLDNLSSDIKTLITDTLEDGDYLKQPRNISDKYIMAYRISTTYDVSGTNEQVEYSELTNSQKEKYNDLIKDRLILANASSYITTNFQNILRNQITDLEIYDPVFEFKFENSYPTIYEPSGNFNNDLVFKFTLNNKEYTYSVADFYNKAKKENASTILTTYFEQEYVYNYFYSYYDDEDNKETHDSNVEALESAISTFNKNENSTYPSNIGLETYLINAYGYKTKEDVIKYYYDAKTILSDYNSKYIFNEWSTDDHKVIDGLDESGIIYNLLQTGNKNYNKLLKLNLDHILINIDADGDGTPDDPDQFLNNDPTKKLDFENNVEVLAQEIYKEAIYIYEQYNTSIKDILTYIKGQFEEGNTLHSDPSKSWSDSAYTKYNFLLTVESLGDIDQASVSNYVVPFADYVKNVYKTALNDTTIESDYDDGAFIVYDGNSKNSSILDNADKAPLITKNTLCKTVYGYHLLVLNSYDKPESTKYTTSDDSEEYQKDIKLLLDEKDEDTDDDNIYIVIDNSYNDKSDEVNFNQFFIYYIQNITGVTSTLDSDISTLLSSMYSDVISMYKNSNFQNYVLLDILNIQSTEYQNIINAEKTYYANVVTSYESDSIYLDWVNGTYTWTRPDAPKNN